MKTTLPLFKWLVIATSIFMLAFPVYPKEIVVAADKKQRYHVELLTHVLSYPDSPYDVVVSGRWLPKNRAFQELADDKLQVVAGSLRYERANHFTAVPFPLLKGLLGWRINLVNASNQDILKGIDTLASLQSLTAGSRDVWSDTKILEGNNLKVLKSESVNALYKMLEKNRYDYFPRSALRIEEDFQRNKQLAIAIDKHILLRYPHAYVYYVNNESTELAEDIEIGLKKAKEDGSLDRIFNKYYGDQVNKLARQSRTLIDLKNPEFPLPELLKDGSYWLTPSVLIDVANIAKKPKTK